MSENLTNEAVTAEQLNTEEIQEIIGHKPHWVVRRGLTLFFLMLVGLVTISAFISYPDVITGAIRLVAIHSPKQLNAKTEGKLEKLLIQNEQIVTTGDHLAFLQSTAKHEQVIKMQSWINTLAEMPAENRIQSVVAYPVPLFYSLGDLQPTYQEFQNNLIEVKQILSNGYYDKKKNSLKQELAYISSLLNNSLEEQKITQQDYEIQKEEFKAKESLLKDKVIAPFEFNQDKSKLIAKEQTLKHVQSQVTNYRLSAQMKEKELADLEKSILDKTQLFQSSLFDFKSKIEDWMQKYVITASESGKVLFASTLQENQLISINQELFYIQPVKSEYYGELMTAQKGLGKVAKGQKVLIKVESYPSQEFGWINGTVDYISSMPNRRDSFIVKVILPKGLRTNFNQDIYFRNNLSGSGEIITRDRRLFERLLGDLSVIIKQQQ